ncbi:hypothetical protein AMS68_002788 [Peltaster fructicola]|uniref:Uncharacterized protein n=1 Tax=Peltaster fructicola TaxID=286661 RepID=A0A6H0XRI9_9PEZI|nr:hypothetical protein AMS68_002788 [Peltaster fructicola]
MPVQDFPYTIATRYGMEVKLRAPNATVEQNEILTKFALAMPAALGKVVPSNVHLLEKHLSSRLYDTYVSKINQRTRPLQKTPAPERMDSQTSWSVQQRAIFASAIELPE